MECYLRKRLLLKYFVIETSTWGNPVVAVAVLGCVRLYFGSRVKGVPISLGSGKLIGELCLVLTV